MKVLTVNRPAEITKGVFKGKEGNLVAYDSETGMVEIQFGNDIVKTHCDNIEQEYGDGVVEPRGDGYCPHCGHDCEDKHIGITSKMYNDYYIETVECSRCHKKFDRVYLMKMLRSQGYKTLTQFIKDGE